MRTVHLVTHPEATHHIDGLVGGWYDSALTPVGRDAAESIAGALRERIPAAATVEVHSSDLRRALQTAVTVAARLGVDVRTDPDLREKSYGEAEGRARAWLDERFVPPPEAGDRLHHDEGIPGSETRWTFATRAYAALDRILAGDAEHQVVVTHGFTATYLIASWIGMPVESVGFVNFRVTSGGITELREDGFFHNRQLVRLDDVAHLATH